MAHPWHDVALPPPERLSEGFPALIEVPAWGKNKYEIDKATGLLRVDRVLYSAVHYPANYGFVPRTYCEDGDPLDVLVLGQEPIVPLCLVWVRAIGAIRMRDEKGIDDKIIAVHLNDPEYSSYHEMSDLPRHRARELERFFLDYKTLEDKEVSIDATVGPDDALAIVRDAAELYLRLRSELPGVRP